MPDKDALLSAIDSYEDQSIGSEGSTGELSRQRALALDAYAGKNITPAPEGRSQVVDMSVFETVQWILPSLTRIFCGDESVVEFVPTGSEDEDAAEQESEVLNYLVTRKGNWFLNCLQFFQDALVTKNAYMLVSMDEKIVPEVERYERQTEEQVAMLLEDDVEVVGQNQYQDPDDEGSLIHPMTGQPVQDEMQMADALAAYEAAGMEPQVVYKQLYDIEVRRTTAKQELCFNVLPPERCAVGMDTPDFSLSNANYFEFWEQVTISDLRKMGYDVEDDIADDGLRESQEDEARDDLFNYTDYQENTDPTLRQVKARTIWIRHDYDGDGIAELQKVILVGREILDHEPASCIPVASIVPFLNTHRHVGMSVADLVFSIQQIKTAMLRAGLDSLYLANNPRHAVNKNNVSIDDLLVSRPGGIVRVDGPPGAGDIMPLPTENTFPYAQQGLLHMDSVIESRVGVSKMFTGIDASAMTGQNAYNAIGQLSTMASQRVEQIARIFGHGIETLFRIAHELVIKSGHSMDSIRLRGEWVEIDPTQWRTGRDMRVVAPYAAGNKDSLLQRLMIHMQIHEKALAGGLPIVQQDDTYELAKMVAFFNDTATTEIYTDPRTIDPPPPQPDYTAMALEIENKKADNQATDTQVDAEIDKYKADLDAQVKQYQVDANAQLQLALANLKAGNSVDLEKVRANLKVNPIEFEGEQIAVSDAFSATREANEAMAQTLTETIDALKEVINQPKRVVRDEAGKVIGVEPA
jgi:hypothetical protein